MRKLFNYIVLCTTTALLTLGCTQSFFLEDNSTPAPPTPNIEINVAGFDMVFVKGGTFTMGATAEQGSDADDREKPTHSVTLSDYYIGKYEVTQAQWTAVMGSNPSKFTGDNNPVDYVSWDDIQEFIKKLNAQTGKRFRLPTEAEWEYAAIGGNKSKGYKYSGSNTVDDVAWYYDNSNHTTHPVGEKQPNELGIYDMTGNVCEWCQDWYGDYSSDSQTNPTGPSSDSNRVWRGGSSIDFAKYCRVSYRYFQRPYTDSKDLGFRLVCSDPELEPETIAYNIGDIVSVNGIKGIIFQIIPMIKIVSVAETTVEWSTEYLTTGATNENDGAKNMAIIKAISGWESKYPAFKWCDNIGNGWYLPAWKELRVISYSKNAIDATLSANGFDKLDSNGEIFWSSSEIDSSQAYDGSISGGGAWYGDKTNDKYPVRAVYAFGDNEEPMLEDTPEPEPDINVGGFDMVFVAGGTFTMGATAEQGSDAGSDEKPTHSVTLSDYYIGKYEVTQAQWKAVMGSNPSNFQGDNLPVETVTWNDVQEFITKLNAQTGKKFRLPTEAEWEYAARGGNKSKGYKYSGSNSISDVAWYGDNSSSKTHPVGQKTPNELGIYDMSGNVCEWCQDWYGSYSSSSQTNPTGPSSGSSRVLRGGSWISSAWSCRVSYRIYINPDFRGDGYGFRLAMDK